MFWISDFGMYPTYLDDLQGKMSKLQCNVNGSSVILPNMPQYKTNFKTKQQFKKLVNQSFRLYLEKL